jgi:HPt (histidine-containing phosphotransfer) domain-containing protein
MEKFNNPNKNLQQNEIILEEKSRINLDNLRAVSRGDVGFMIKMIDHFIMDTPASVDRMEKLAAVGEYKTLGEIAHKIKPSVNFLGAGELETEIKAIERDALDGKNTQQLPDMIAKFKVNIEGAIAELKEEKQKLANEI